MIKMSNKICLLIFLNYLLIISNKEEKNEKKNEPEIFTQKDNVGLYRISSSVVSPDKKYTVFVSSKWDESTGKTIVNLKYKNIEDESEVSDLTPATDDKSDTNPVFSSKFPDYVFFLRKKEERVHVYYTPLNNPEGVEPTKLTDYPIDISNLKIEGNTMVFSAFMFDKCDDMQCTADEEKEIKNRGENTYQIYTELMVRHWDHWYVENETSHVWMQKLNSEDGKPTLSGDAIDLLSTNKHVCSPPFEGGADQFSISPDENYIAFSGHEKNEKMAYNTKWDIYLYDVANNELTPITQTEDQKGRCQNPAFNNDSNKLAFLSMDREGLESDYLKMRIYDLNSKEIKKPVNQEDWAPSVSGFVWLDSEKDIFIYNVVEEGYLKLYKYQFNEDKNNTYILLTNDTNGYTGSPVQTNENTYLIEYSSFTFPTVIGILEKKEESSELLTARTIVDLNQDIKKYDLQEPESFNYTATDGTRIQGFILKPVNFNPDVKYPLAFLIHGGPEGAWSNSWSYRWNPQIWAHHSYSVVFINPRGSSGMGIEFQDAVRNDWGGVPFTDLMDGFDYVKDTYNFTDTDKAGACGASYGGFMVNWIQGNDDQKRFKCLVTHDGVFSTITMFYATEELWFPMAEYCDKNKLGCKPYEGEEQREGYEKFNPERFVQNWETPHLIIHGGKDYRIPISEGISAFAALQLKKVPSRFLYFPDENHWVLKPENSIKWYEEVLAWLDNYVLK